MSENRSLVAAGVISFSAVMMIVLGAFDALQGLGAIAKKSYFAVSENYLWKLNVTTWGWIHLVLGVVVVLAGLALFTGAAWARVVGVVVAVLVAISNFLWLPYQPVWSVLIIAASVVVIWALTAHGRDVTY